MSKDKAKIPTFSGPVVLGIHSNLAGDEHSFTSGHAWISVQEGSKTVFFGLWPDGHPRTVDNKGKSDVRVNMEAGSRPAASRFYRLSKVRTKRLNAFLKKRVHWDYTHNCSSWASDLFYSVVGIDVDANDWLGVETPRELGASIKAMESGQTTSRKSPASPGDVQQSSLAG